MPHRTIDHTLLAECEICKRKFLSPHPAVCFPCAIRAAGHEPPSFAFSWHEKPRCYFKPNQWLQLALEFPKATTTLQFSKELILIKAREQVNKEFKANPDSVLLAQDRGEQVVRNFVNKRPGDHAQEKLHSLCTDLLTHQGQDCFYCGRLLTEETMEIDVVIGLNIKHSGIAKRTIYNFFDAARLAHLAVAACRVCSGAKAFNEQAGRMLWRHWHRGAYLWDGRLFTETTSERRLPPVELEHWQGSGYPELRRKLTTADRFTIASVMPNIALRFTKACRHQGQVYLAHYNSMTRTVEFACPACSNSRRMENTACFGRMQAVPNILGPVID